MTAEALFLTAGPMVRLQFLDTLEPMALLTPAQAATMLAVKQHTLACYRNLGIGPAYYKFGKKIFYDPDDIQIRSSTPRVGAEPVKIAPPPGSLIDSVAAARFLGVTKWCLINYRRDGGGPPVRQLGRRHYYPADRLWQWAQHQRVAPRTMLSIDMPSARRY